MAAKKLVVSLDYNQPQFEFEGEWTGKDVKTAMTHLRRAYLKHVKAVRAQAINEVADATVTQGGE